MVDDLFIVGAGGIGRYVAEQLGAVRKWRESWRIAGFLDDNPALHSVKIDGVPVLGKIDLLARFAPCAVVVAVANPRAKYSIVQRLSTVQGLDYPSLIHPRAWLAPSVSLGKGTIVYPGVTINHNVSMGDFVIVNMGCALGHHTVIDNYCALAPKAALAGHTYLEQGVDFGIAACTIQRCRIGKWSRVGAGAAVLRDVPSTTTVAGVPAKPLLP